MPPKQIEADKLSTQVLIRVVTTDLATAQTTEKIIDHNDREQRQWLGKHCFWAVRNNHSVLTTPIAK
ncbi:hypothetical protein CAZ10_10175 [Pseudomonas aeruginosa]|uniref:Uncharacterized protein n=1 Tax=Pseudomonas aeruginosa TaxID=287 RepID=A0A241XRR3_PSEAI|nr:hypothetical protein [Pseudomonas aeruginosa]OBY58939.1 hypothetical protein A9513_001090 [Pseudomonas sp. AU12215]OTI63192.1 hypothetical protein CAZ10_10175 [Pseudomonas aeruginosa]